MVIQTPCWNYRVCGLVPSFTQFLSDTKLAISASWLPGPYRAHSHFSHYFWSLSKWKFSFLLNDHIGLPQLGSLIEPRMIKCPFLDPHLTMITLFFTNDTGFCFIRTWSGEQGNSLRCTLGWNKLTLPRLPRHQILVCECCRCACNVPDEAIYCVGTITEHWFNDVGQGDVAT